MARRDGRLADVDVTGVLDLVVGGGALHPAALLGSRDAVRRRKGPRELRPMPLLGSRNVTRRRERPCEIFPVPFLGSRDAARRLERPREIFVIARRAGGGAFLRPVPRFFKAQSGDARV